MATNYGNLRDTALKSRQESTQAWLSRYCRARDEFFQVIVEGASEKMQTSAQNGRFRAKVYEYTKGHRGENSADTTSDETMRLRYGQCTEDENGLHVETIFRPRGVPYRETLMSKLKEHFNSSTESSNDEQRQDFTVYYSRHPQNPRQGAVFVSWERARGDDEAHEQNGFREQRGQRRNPPRRFNGPPHAHAHAHAHSHAHQGTPR